MKRKIIIIMLAFTLTLMVLSFFDLSKVVKASPGPGISVTILDVDPNAGGTDDQASYIVRVESITTEFEDANLIVSGHPSLSFNWTLQIFSIFPGEIKEFPLKVTVAYGTLPGDHSFTAVGNAWLPFLPEFPEASSYTSYVHVTSLIGPPTVKVGGFENPVNKFSLLAPYILFALTIPLAAVATTVFVKHHKKTNK